MMCIALVRVASAIDEKTAGSWYDAEIAISDAANGLDLHH
jgi:hypothetical protein